MAPSGGFGGPPGGAMGSAFSGAMGAPGAAGMPSVRNPLMTLLIPMGIIVGGAIVGAILGMIASFLSLVGTLIILGGVGFMFYSIYTMLTELKEVTKDPEFNWWYVLIPYFGLYFMWIKVPEQVTKAKQMAGSRNPQAAGLVMYLFLSYYALAKDLNEVWDPTAA